jgi:hypothetical protein
MPRPDDPSSDPAEQTDGDVPNLGPTSDPSGRDFGDSAGYGSGGSTRDYQAVIPPAGSGGQDEEQAPDTPS